MKRKWKLWAALVYCLVLMAAAMTGCSGKSKLPEGFSEEEVKAQAEKDITLGESGDYEGWIARFAEEYRSSIPEESYEAYLAVVKEKGAFKSFGKAAFVGQEQDGKKYAGIIYIVEHEGGEVKYTLGYDENMNLIQFFV